MSHYLNLKTLGLGAVALVAVVALVPGAIAYLPLPVLLACPLAMYFMMRGHGGHMGHVGHLEGSSGESEVGSYTCPMHEEIKSTFPGKCPICEWRWSQRQARYVTANDRRTT